jgi:hypothetical protein
MGYDLVTESLRKVQDSLWVFDQRSITDLEFFTLAVRRRILIGKRRTRGKEA